MFCSDGYKSREPPPFLSVGIHRLAAGIEGRLARKIDNHLSSDGIIVLMVRSSLFTRESKPESIRREPPP
ncbi:MAG: hypothetical protein P5681_11185 [Limnospira sp. PMC 894.15]|nr:hypothetical protein [Limnospira sp. PMC 894.15]